MIRNDDLVMMEALFLIVLKTVPYLLSYDGVGILNEMQETAEGRELSIKTATGVAGGGLMSGGEGSPEKTVAASSRRQSHESPVCRWWWWW